MTIGHHRITIGHYFFSISKHKANTTELHPKVRQTCCIYIMNNEQGDTVLVPGYIRLDNDNSAELISMDSGQGGCLSANFYISEYFTNYFFNIPVISR